MTAPAASWLLTFQAPTRGFKISGKRTVDKFAQAAVRLGHRLDDCEMIVPGKKL